MNTRIAVAISAAILIVAAVYGGRQLVDGRRARVSARAMAQTDGWAPAARAAVQEMIERYGPPQKISSFELRWEGPSPWKRIVIQNEPQSPLEEVAAHPFPEDKAFALERFPHGLRVYPEEGALGARNRTEALNFLSLNLADDIATGRTTPEDANDIFVRTVRLQESGKSSPYMERLLFKTPGQALPP